MTALLTPKPTMSQPYLVTMHEHKTSPLEFFFQVQAIFIP